MNTFLLSIAYIEDCIKDNFDIFINSNIEVLYLLNENHNLTSHNTKTDNGRYSICYIQNVESLQKLKDLELYIVYCECIPKSTLEKITSFAQRTNNNINVISNGYDHIKIRQSFNQFNISILDSGNFIGLNDGYIFSRIYKRKPIIFICGLSFGNMQPKLELTLVEYLKKHGITYDLFSYYCPYPHERLEFDLTRESNVLSRIEHVQNNNNNIMIFSLPLNLLSLSPENESAVSSLIKRIRPDYSVCCVNNDPKMLKNIKDAYECLRYKYNIVVDSFYVSNYTINNIEYFGENQPLLLHSKECDIDFANVLIVDDSVSSLRQMMAKLISKLTFPAGVTIV